MALSEIIRFVLPSSRSSLFSNLRDYISVNGGVKDQYYGYMVSPLNSALQIRKDEICWVIQWPHNSDMYKNASFRAQLSELISEEKGKALFFQFKDTQIPNLKKALEAPVCEFAIINLSPNAPQSNTDFKHSMHKTYTDCYRMHGFIGGDWAYSVNTNNTNETLIDSEQHQWLPEKERRLACYYLGWESINHHEAASATPIFAEEMIKLMPWIGKGSGAWYVTFKRHQ